MASSSELASQRQECTSHHVALLSASVGVHGVVTCPMSCWHILACVSPVQEAAFELANTMLVHNADEVVLLQIFTNGLFHCGEENLQLNDPIPAFRPQPAEVGNVTPPSDEPAPSPTLLSPLSPGGQYASRSAGRPPLTRPAPQVCTAASS